ncbi:hypothetical protein [uncultured Bacteroides sp.]|uniref:hypothetical protein n=1 Tax=uncultured Bacteroides sp. TaxID=162156 RepID=UPI0025E61FEC|nr:hypothetical protein [uncultured Bacteroides sp.]
MMKRRILFLLVAIGLSAGITATAGMNTGKVRKETRFLTDKMAHELNLSTQQYNDAYEINYDFVYSIRDIMDYVARGYEWALDDYYEALDIRNDDLRWVLSDGQYRRFMGADYFFRPIYVTGGKWNFRIYINYPNRSLFYFGVPYHYRTYCGAHYRPHIHHVSFYRGRHTNVRHYATPHRVKDGRTFHSYRRSDFGSVHFRPNSSVRPHNAPARPGANSRPAAPSGNRKPNKEITPDRNGGRRESSVSRRPASSKPTSAESKRESKRDFKRESKRPANNSSSRRSNVSPQRQPERRSSSSSSARGNNGNSSRSSEREKAGRR